MAARGYLPIIFVLILLFISASAEIKAQHRIPPLDFEQFRRDVAAAQSPEEKLTRYLDISQRVFRNHPDSLFTFAKEIRNVQGLEAAKRNAFEHFFLAYAWRPANRDSAIYYGIRAAEQLKKINQHEPYLRTKNLLGIEYRRQSDYLKAEAAFLEGLNYSLSLDSTYYPTHYFYGNLGMLYSTVSAHGLAVKMFEEFMEFSDSPGDRCRIISRLTDNLIALKEFEKAEQMLVPCLELANLPPPIQSITRANLSEVVDKMGHKGYSLTLMEEAASISAKYKIPNLHIGYLIQLGNQYLDMNLIQKADSVRIIINKTDFRGYNRHFDIEKYLFLSNLALATDNYKNTIAYADSAIYTAGASNNLKFFLKKVYATKAQAYEKLGKMDLAVKSLRLQDKLDEQRITEEKIRSETMMKVRYQLQNQEDELALANSRLAKMNDRNFLLLVLVIIIGFIGGFIYSRYRKSRSYEETIAAELQERDVTISELEQKITEQNRKLKERNKSEWVELNSQVKLSLDEIRYIKSDGNYIKIFLSDVERAPIMERLTLKQCEEMLPDEITLRIHRSTIVNIRHVSHISNEVLFLKDDTQLKISRRYKRELVNTLS